MTVPLLRRLREAKGWSVRELGRRARVRHALISELETGKKTDTQYRLWRRLAKALDVTVDELLAEMPEEDLRAIPHAEPLWTSRQREGGTIPCGGTVCAILPTVPLS